MLTTVNSIVNIIGGRGPIRPLSKYDNLHFENEDDLHLSSKKFEANDYGHDLEVLTIDSH